MRREHNIQSILPPGYRQLEYIESTGTQYIETPYYAKSYTEFDVGFVFNNAVNNQGHSIFGARHEYNSLGYQLTGWTNTSSLKGHFLYNGTRYNAGIVRGEYMELSLRNRKLYKNNAQISSLGNYTFTCDVTMSIFSCRNLNSAFFEPSSTRLYFLTFYENSNKVMEFIPALRTSDSKPGLYNLTNNQFYTNAGTGEFLYN